MAEAHHIRQVNRSAETGYWLSEAFQGRGIMVSAVSVLFGYLFIQRGLNRIEARCAVHNERSRSVMERLGMRHEGTLREGELLPGGYTDQLIYGMLAEEWQRRGGKLCSI